MIQFWNRIVQINRSSPTVAAITIFLTALIVRSFTAILVTQPGYSDSYYYYQIAQNIYHGRGFVEDIIWNYLEGASTITHPSNTYWMPLSSVAIAASFRLFGLSFRAAQVPMIVASCLLPVIGYWIGNDIFRKQRYAWGIAGLTIFSGLYFLYWTVPEAFGLFAVFGSLTLTFAYKALRDSPKYLVVAGGLVALAQLTRADGALLLSSLAAVLIALLLAEQRSGRRQYMRILSCGLGALFAYVLVLSPWMLRNILEFGRPLPTIGLKAAFLREYDDMFAYGHSIDLEYYMSWGLMAILKSKISALAETASVWIKTSALFPAPFALIGFWQLRRKIEYLPFHVYNLLLFVVMSLVFTFPGPRGSYTHSAAALLPFFFGAALVGADSALTFAARFRPRWAIPVAQRDLTIALVMLSVAVSMLWTTLLVRQWDEELRGYRQVASWLGDKLDDDEPVVILDPPKFYYASGHPAIITANDPPQTTAEIARRLGARYIVLQLYHLRPLDKIYNGEENYPGARLEASFGQFRIFKLDETATSADTTHVDAVP